MGFKNNEIRTFQNFAESTPSPTHVPLFIIFFISIKYIHRDFFIPSILFVFHFLNDAQEG